MRWYLSIFIYFETYLFLKFLLIFILYLKIIKIHFNSSRTAFFWFSYSLTTILRLSSVLLSYFFNLTISLSLSFLYYFILSINSPYIALYYLTSLLSSALISLNWLIALSLFYISIFSSSYLALILMTSSSTYPMISTFSLN